MRRCQLAQPTLFEREPQPCSLAIGQPPKVRSSVASPPEEAAVPRRRTASASHQPA
ncbi:MAG: hypothetical protein ACREBG_15815 [Pyrinomonadaceae bacterium]